MIMIGPVILMVDTASVDAIKRAWSWNWSDNVLVNYGPQPQYTGPAGQTLNITGSVKEFAGFGFEVTVDMLPMLANTGLPQIVITGAGEYLGFWSINSVTKDGSELTPTGRSKTILYSVDMKYYGLTDDPELNRKIYEADGAHIKQAALDVALPIPVF